MDNLIRQCASMFAVLGQENRIRIVEELLQNHELCVYQITTRLEGNQPNISRHISILLRSDILNGRREIPKHYYSIRHPKIKNLIQVLNEVSSGSTNRMAEIMYVLSEPSRLAIVDALREKMIGLEIGKKIGRPKSAVSRHLSVLVEAMIVSPSPQVTPTGSCVYYHVRKPGILRIVDLVKEIYADEITMRLKVAEPYGE